MSDPNSYTSICIRIIGYFFYLTGKYWCTLTIIFLIKFSKSFHEETNTVESIELYMNLNKQTLNPIFIDCKDLFLSREIWYLI